MSKKSKGGSGKKDFKMEMPKNKLKMNSSSLIGK